MDMSKPNMSGLGLPQPKPAVLPGGKFISHTRKAQADMAS
jgi:hypothetical protein